MCLALELQHLFWAVLYEYRACRKHRLVDILLWHVCAYAYECSALVGLLRIFLEQVGHIVVVQRAVHSDARRLLPRCQDRECCCVDIYSSRSPRFGCFRSDSSSLQLFHRGCHRFVYIANGARHIIHHKQSRH